MRKFNLPFASMLCLLLCFFSYSLIGQDIEKLLDKDKEGGIFSGDPFKINGSIGFNLRSYSTNGIENRQSPFTWYLHGNTNISIYQINIPFSVLVSQQSREFSHPFHEEAIENRISRIGASPYYKWIKLHGGHRNMRFSPLTVAGHTYLGAGIELTPGKLRFGAFYGKLAKTEPRDLSLQNPNVELFGRKGWGAKVGYGTTSSFIDFIVFKAQDDPNSNFVNTDSAALYRNENLVLGLNGKTRIFNKIDLNLEIASSAFTENSNEEEAGNTSFPHPSFLIDPKASTNYRWAIDASANYRLKSVSFGLGYKRIEPDYRSLGAYFFNNDLENYTANVGFALLKSKIRVNANGGIQRNNLFGEKSTQLNRTIAAINANYAIKNFNLGLTYSNYTSDIDFVLNAELDSLNAVIVTQQGGINASYNIISSKDARHTISTNFTISNVADDVEDPARSSESRMYNANFIYVYMPKDRVWKVRGRLNYNQNQLSQMLINRYGAGLGLTRQIIEKKWSVSLDTNYYNSKGETIDNQTLNMRLSSPFTLGEKHRIDLSFLYLNRFKSNAGSTGNFSEFTGIAGYIYSF